VEAVPPDDVLSINTPVQLAQVDAILRRRLEQEVSGPMRPARRIENPV
jgi:hypothetical protein